MSASIPLSAFPYPSNPEQVPGIVLHDDFSGTHRTVYQCPDCCWRAHLNAWKDALRRGLSNALEPMPAGHLMFEHPASNGHQRVK